MIIDCFPVSRELDVLEIRMATLYPLVDYFVIAEAPVTFSGNPKPLLYLENIKRFDRWNDKVRHVIVDDMPGGIGTEASCVREAHQKAAIGRALPPNLKDDDILIMGDCDEIPKPEVLRAYHPDNDLVGLEWKSFLFYLNLEFQCKQPNWTKIFPARLLHAWSLWDIRCRDCHFHKILPDSAWHFTYMGGAQAIANKASANAGFGGIPDEWRDPKACQDALDNIENDASKNIIRNFHKLTIRGKDYDYPQYIRDNWHSLIKRGLIYVPQNERAKTS